MSATVCQLTIKLNSRAMTSSDNENSTRLVLDQNSSKVHDRYTTSLYTFWAWENTVMTVGDRTRQNIEEHDRVIT